MLLPEFLQNYKSILTERLTYRKLGTVAALLDVFCLLLIFALVLKPTQHLISPLFAPLQSLVRRNTAYETFTFAPGSGYNKLTRIDYNGLSAVAFFDVPVNPDGSLQQYSNGYQTFRSSDFSYVQQSATTHKTKTVVTFTQGINKNIRAFLSDTSAQQTFIDEAIREVTETGIDGITIDFEYTGAVDPVYKQKYSAFVARTVEAFHKKLPHSQVNVAIPGAVAGNTLYDTFALASSADRVYVMAYTFAATETNGTERTAPLNGVNEKDYWNNVYAQVDALSQTVPASKLVIERAWYGNGTNFPSYDNGVPDDFVAPKNAMKLPLSEATIESMIAGVPSDAKAAARRNIPLIAKALNDEHILTPNVLAYALATIEHETAGTFEPIEEYGGRFSARRLGYEGGTNYFGRGFIQLTHLRNYKRVGQRIGMGEELVKNPELALNPEISAKILAAFFKDNGIARLASNGNFIAARQPINPDRNGWLVATLAYKFM